MWPTCYTTCDLYSARPDGGCRRFVDGMVRIELPTAVNSYVLKIRFKRWGKLWTPGNVRLHSAEKAEKLEKRDHVIGRTLQRIPLPSLVKITAATKLYGFKKRTAALAYRCEEMPSYFLLECYNPEAHSVPLSLTMRATDERARIPYQKLIHLTPGFHRIKIPFEEITELLDLKRPFGIELTPNDEARETTLYFGLMEFAKDLPATEDSNQLEKKIKCVVWDLDNTLWDGVLVEDGAERLQIKSGLAAIIQELDRRGILHSVVSKNNPEDALQAIKNFQLDEYFLCPQISWQPKSQGIKAIAQQLNIGLDSLLFVDDSTFELEEVGAVCPEVRLLRAEEYRTLPERSDCSVAVTAESRERRKLYQVQEARHAVAQKFSHDYMAFLRHCEIRLTVRPMTEANLDRVHELTQRTNQMNFSGNRYDRNVLQEILSSPYVDTFVLSCEDRFGSYGVIGFSIVDRREPRLTDLMFSCRVQSKRVEHAFLACTIRKYIEETGRDFYADYRKTPRNAPSGKVFADVGMEEVENRNGVLSLRFRKDWEIPEDGIIQVEIQDLIQGTPA
ncbi:MAG TPA: HAD-IIIC family phosphatase [Candidatus Eremiobacteraceae bacterium]|nr:HAD-IIIC family phosphatase [Candidatus Eremiobacteraceae bacterium]